MGTKQKAILECLRQGEHIDSEIPGWFWHHAKLREETRTGLENTGELVELWVAGKWLQMHWIIHESQVASITQKLQDLGKTVIDVRPIKKEQK